MKWLGRTDPLVLFLVAGLALYLILDALGLGRGDDRLITVDEPAIAAFIASEGGRLPGRTLDGMSLKERRKLVEDYVREEALYREARALGLDREDTAIRRRLVQSLRFSLQGDDDTVLEPGFTAHLIIGIWEPEDAYVLSETIEVGENKGFSLSQTPRELFVR